MVIEVNRVIKVIIRVIAVIRVFKAIKIITTPVGIGSARRLSRLRVSREIDIFLI